PAREIGVKTFACFYERREHFERSTPRSRGRSFDLLHNRGDTLLLDRQITVWTKLRPGFREQETEKMIDLRHRRDGGLPTAARDPLLDRHAWRQTGDKIDIRFLELLDKLPRVGRHAVKKPALSFREYDIECGRSFTRRAHGRHHDPPVAAALPRDAC